MRCRIREIMKLTALLVLIFPVLQCNHPFEEGMTGSFPVFELESSQYITLPASGTSSELKGTIKVYVVIRWTVQLQQTRPRRR